MTADYPKQFMKRVVITLEKQKDAVLNDNIEILFFFNQKNKNVEFSKRQSLKSQERQ
jgi:hypothetical protein